MPRTAGIAVTLRQPRYVALGAVMLIVALGCIAAGVWQVYRYESKHDDNQQLRRNAKIAVTSPAAVLPVVGRAAAPGRDAVEFRQVRVTGRYDAANQTLVRNRTVGDDTGFLLVTPLRTSGPTLLVVRGFIDQPPSGSIPAAPAPPEGRVTITARTQAPETKSDQFAAIGQRQVTSINPADQAARLGTPVYDGFAELEAQQPGTEGLVALPRPDLSNPAGGAFEPQHFAYVVQWFLFAALAVAAPFVMARAENKRKDDDDAQFDDVPLEEPTPDEARAAKLTSRYGKVREI